MSTDDERLVVELEARINDFEKNFEKANRTAGDNWNKIEARGRSAGARIEADMSKAVAGIGGAFTTLGGTIASSVGLSGVLGLSGFLALAVKINSELAKTSSLARLAGLSTDRLQEVKFAANVKGVSNDDFATDLGSSVRLLDEAQRQVNSLQKLFNANGLSIKDSNGQLIKFDQLLENAAKLMQNTNSEQGKIKIAEMLGLSSQWVAVLRGGPEAFRKTASEASGAGAVIDKEMIAKAKEFDRQWTEAMVRLKAGLTSTLTDLASAFGEFWSTVVDSVPGGSFLRDKIREWSGGLAGMTLPELQDALKRTVEQGIGQFEVDRIQEEIDKRLGKKPLKITVTPEVAGDNSTVIPKDKEKNPFDRAVFETNKRIAATDAETRTIGMNTEARERAKIVAELEEAAKKANTEAGIQNATVTDAQREKINKLADAMEAAGKRQREAQEQFKSFNETLQFTGNMAVDFFDKLGDKATTFASIVTSAMATVKKAVLNALILGQGPLAGLFGTATTVSGGTGGLFGSLGKLLLGGSSNITAGGGGAIPIALTGNGGIGHAAGGGSFDSGDWSVVGEKGPELVRFGASANVIPNDVSRQLVAPASVAPAGAPGSMSSVVHAPISINVQGGSQGPQADADLAAQIGRHVEGAVRGVVAKELRTQMRPGGILTR
jgi:hypothetical protein